jgi:hypothetical protein
MDWKRWARCTAWKIAGYNADGFLLLGVPKGPGVTHMLLVSKIKKKPASVLWKKSLLKCVATLSGCLNNGWTLCKQQRELRPKCSETVRGGEKKTF